MKSRKCELFFLQREYRGSAAPPIASSWGHFRLPLRWHKPARHCAPTSPRIPGQKQGPSLFYSSPKVRRLAVLHQKLGMESEHARHVSTCFSDRGDEEDLGPLHVRAFTRNEERNRTQGSTRSRKVVDSFSFQTRHNSPLGQRR